ncbi:Sec-independent protein translocase protein TatB [compost metagenome]|jgi:sec-independent protein translocase protein TatB|uniref:Twin-arginine translocation protein, TatB subunit n=1 Tax=Pseudomonas putida (strain W619) TaxID=390235 RepID=B1JDG9_PSEPW|nr:MULTISPECIES: Sec-independent protein translocase protein TatB [Pseudomonas]KHL72028.1 preprotein translocase subunit TatA [Pseudomonas putida]MDH1571563.1 Sec-independent protein translocase protein TatB [Pseudomonas sp. GD03746]QQE83125.1 twin-arginine translocase subunit TatB [Pseudomonas putida]UTL80270.1 Sec-independent protein translocase protein TatB [Pseudomonas putida]HEK1692703.1 twin-arginine translocase subunit TatB [Pseudomonas putida]
MFEVGFSEMLLVGIVALLVLGPERLPVAARTLGRGLGQARRAMQGLRAQMEREIDMPNLDSAPLQRLEQELRQGISLKAEPATDAATVTVIRETTS